MIFKKKMYFYLLLLKIFISKSYYTELRIYPKKIKCQKIACPNSHELTIKLIVNSIDLFDDVTYFQVQFLKYILFIPKILQLTILF